MKQFVWKNSKLYEYSVRKNVAKFILFLIMQESEYFDTVTSVKIFE